MSVRGDLLLGGIELRGLVDLFRRPGVGHMPGGIEAEEIDAGPRLDSTTDEAIELQIEIKKRENFTNKQYF